MVRLLKNITYYRFPSVCKALLRSVYWPADKINVSYTTFLFGLPVLDDMSLYDA